MSRTTKSRSPQSYTYVAVPITLEDGTDSPELVVCANQESADIYLNLTAVELRDLRQAGHKQERVRLPTNALDRFAVEDRWTVDKPDLYIHEEKGVLKIGFMLKDVWIERELGVGLVKEAYVVRDRLINLGKDGSLGAFFKVLGVSAISDEDRRPNRESGQGQRQRQPDQGRRDGRSQGNRGQQGGGQGRNSAPNQPPRPPKAETPKVEAAPPTAPAAETEVKTEVATSESTKGTPGKKARRQETSHRPKPGAHNGRANVTFGDVLGDLKLQTASSEEAPQAPIPFEQSICGSEDDATEADQAKVAEPCECQEVAATPIANDQVNESDSAAGEVDEAERFGKALRESMGDGTTVDQAIA